MGAILNPPSVRLCPPRGSASAATTGLGIEKASNLTQEDAEDEFSAYRKRMMLAYRFRPNPLVSSAPSLLPANAVQQSDCDYMTNQRLRKSKPKKFGGA